MDTHQTDDNARMVRQQRVDRAVTRLVLAGYESDAVAESTAILDALGPDNDTTLLAALPAILDALHVLGGPDGAERLRAHLRDTYLLGAGE